MNVDEFEALFDREIEKIVDTFPEIDHVECEIEIIRKNEIIKCDLIRETDSLYEVQFFDGTIAYLNKSHFKLN